MKLHLFCDNTEDRITGMELFSETGRDCKGVQKPQGSGVRVQEGKGRGWDSVPS